MSHAVEAVFREQGAAVLATLIRQLGDFQLAEDALQDALAAAVERWGEAPPKSPGAWILTTARRKALDRLRHRGVQERKQSELERIAAIERAAAPKFIAEAPIADDGLRLIFTCCHPALSTDASIALTLRTLGGLTTDEIARAFLVPDATMAQRIVRAKRKIMDAKIPYRIPDADEMPARLDRVLSVLYLIFNEGYFPCRGDYGVRADLCEEAIHLSANLSHLLPNAEVDGLLALMHLQYARRRARLDGRGVMVALEDQNRALWDQKAIEGARALLHRALRQGPVGPYLLQASIAALHAEARRAEDTDWPQIVLLYRELYTRFPSPVVELNLVVALANLRDPAECLRRIEGLEGLDEYQPYHAARADLMRRCGRGPEAADAYRRAIALTDNQAVIQFLQERLAALGRLGS